MADMAGCPNRCRHCWLGEQPNGHMDIEDFKEIAALFKEWRDDNGNGINELGFFSWWQEPDYRDDYRELWNLEQELSSPGRARRFELLSTWRLSRDTGYAPWAAALPTKVKVNYEKHGNTLMTVAYEKPQRGNTNVMMSRHGKRASRKNDRMFMLPCCNKRTIMVH